MLANQTIVRSDGLPVFLTDIVQQDQPFELGPYNTTFKIMFGYYTDIYNVAGAMVDQNQLLATSDGPQRLVDVYAGNGLALFWEDGATVERHIGLPRRSPRQPCFSIISEVDSMYIIGASGLLMFSYGEVSYAPRGQDWNQM